MDLRLYRSAADKDADLRKCAVSDGVAFGIGAFTLREIVERLTPWVSEVTDAQRNFCIERALSTLEAPKVVGIVEYSVDAVSELKAAGVTATEIQDTGQTFLCRLLEAYNWQLTELKLVDSHDRCRLASKQLDANWLARFDQIVLCALYDLTNAEFDLIAKLTERFSGGARVSIFNSTTNIRPTQFAEWTWQRFIRDDVLAERSVPDFFRATSRERPLLERLFEYEPSVPLEPDPDLLIVEADGRYDEIESIGSRIHELIASGIRPSEIGVIVRHLEDYGEMIEDVFLKYRIPHVFGTRLPLIRVPFIKFWLSVLDLAVSERSRYDFAKAMNSAYFRPRFSPEEDVELLLTEIGYHDRRSTPFVALATTFSSPLKTEIKRFEAKLDELEASEETLAGFLERLPPPEALSPRDADAWGLFSESMKSLGEITERVSFIEFRRQASAVASLGRIERLAADRMVPGIDSVTVAGPHVLGYRSFKALFAPGFEDGGFPSPGWMNPLLDDGAVEEINKSIQPRSMMRSWEKNRREPLYLFMILDSAPMVILSYPRINLRGDSVYPSIYVREIERHYRVSQIIKSGIRQQPLNEAERLKMLAERWREERMSVEHGDELLGPDIMRRVNAEQRGVSRSNVGEGIVDKDFNWHPTQITQVGRCPFVFLAVHLLDIEVRREPAYDIPARDMGVIAHRVLADFHSMQVPSDEEVVRKRMEKVIKNNLSRIDMDMQGPFTKFDPSIWPIRREQLVGALQAYVKFAIEDKGVEYETLEKYLDLPLPEVKVANFRLNGRPDHVTMRRSETNIDHVRVDDFKYSSSGDFFKRGLGSLQLDIYMYLICEALRAADEPITNKTVLDGRYVLLRAPHQPLVTKKYKEGDLKDALEEVSKLVQVAQEGRFQAAPAEPQACPKCDYRRLCRLYVN